MKIKVGKIVKYRDNIPPNLWIVLTKLYGGLWEVAEVQCLTNRKIAHTKDIKVVK